MSHQSLRIQWQWSWWQWSHNVRKEIEAQPLTVTLFMGRFLAFASRTTGVPGKSTSDGGPGVPERIALLAEAHGSVFERLGAIRSRSSEVPIAQLELAEESPLCIFP